MNLDSLIVKATELYEAIPETDSHAKRVAYSLVEDLTELRDEQVVPAWLVLVDELLRYVGIAIITAAYIFRSQHTGKQTVEASVRYASQAHLRIISFMKTGDANLNYRTDSSDNIVVPQKENARNLYKVIQEMHKRKE